MCSLFFLSVVRSQKSTHQLLCPPQDEMSELHCSVARQLLIGLEAVLPLHSVVKTALLEHSGNAADVSCRLVETATTTIPVSSPSSTSPSCGCGPSSADTLPDTTVRLEHVLTVCGAYSH